jgi:hypothetical protein
MALLQAGREPGRLELTAHSPGLLSAKIGIEVARGAAKPCLFAVNPASRLDLSKAGTAKTRPAAGIKGLAWTRPDFEEDGWQPVSLAGKPLLPSPSCLRIRFSIPDTMPAGKLVLDLGVIHDFDETWLNGKRLGSINPRNMAADMAWRTPRRYVIPARSLRPGGTQVLAIRAWNHRRTPDARTHLPGPMLVRADIEA